MSASLCVTQRSVGAVVILELDGRLLYDDDGERMLREQVTAMVAAGERHFLIDLSRVTHMDSGSVGTIVALHLHTLKRGGRLKLLSPNERVQRVLHMTRLESIFETFTSEDDAVRSFALPVGT